MRTPTELAQLQLDTFNAHDLDAFLAVFAEDVAILDLASGHEVLRGIDAFRDRYEAVFRDQPRVHAELVGRLAVGSHVIDQERVTTGDGASPEDALAIYEVDGGRIARMWFLVPGQPS